MKYNTKIEDYMVRDVLDILKLNLDGFKKLKKKKKVEQYIFNFLLI